VLPAEARLSGQKGPQSAALAVKCVTQQASKAPSGSWLSDSSEQQHTSISRETGQDCAKKPNTATRSSTRTQPSNSSANKSVHGGHVKNAKERQAV
jgi:hypothetical protein